MSHYGVGLFPGVVGKGIASALVLIVICVSIGSFIATKMSHGPVHAEPAAEKAAVSAPADSAEKPKEAAKQ